MRNPTCAGNCNWNGEACINEQNVGNVTQQSTLFSRFYEGASGYGDDDQNSNNRGSNRKG